MTLTVAERVVPIRAPWEVAVLLRSKERRERATTVVLRSVASAVAAGDAWFHAAFEAARSFPAVEGPERPQGLPFLSLLMVPLAKPLVRRQLVAVLNLTPTALLSVRPYGP